MNGNWGVFPYFPSGAIVVSNIEDGLYVFTPTYAQACYLEGTVTDSITGFPINGATIKVTGSSLALTETTNISGVYATGAPAPGGTFTITYSATKYKTKTITGVQLSSGALTLKDVKLIPTASGIFDNELYDASLSVYPNPFTNDINISYEFQSKVNAGSAILLTDMLGKEIQKFEVSDMKGNLSINTGLNAGVYFVRIVSGQASSSPIKIIKMEE